MKGLLETFVENKMFYKESTGHEYEFLKLLHGNNLHLKLVTKNDKEFIEMPEGIVISCDTIPIEKRANAGIRAIIHRNISAIIEQTAKLNSLGIFYSDQMQWLYYSGKMYLIDFDIAHNRGIDTSFDNFDLLINFLSRFYYPAEFLRESLNMLSLFQAGDSLLDEEVKLYNWLKNDNIKPEHIYHCRDRRHIQIPVENIHIYGETGNMVITEKELDLQTVKEWELIKIV